MKCPYCGEMIDDNAKKCRYCMSWIVSGQPQAAQIQTVQPQTAYPQAFYYMLVNGKQVGPIGEKDLLANGLTPSTMVWRNGMVTWNRAQDVPELSQLFGMQNQQNNQKRLSEKGVSISSWLSKPLLITVCCVLIVVVIASLLNEDDYGREYVPGWVIGLIGCVEVLLPMALVVILRKHDIKAPATTLVIFTIVACFFFIMQDFNDVMAFLWFMAAMGVVVMSCVVGSRILASNVNQLRAFSKALIYCNIGIAIVLFVSLIVAMTEEANMGYAVSNSNNETLYGVLGLILIIARIVLYSFWIHLFVKEIDD